MLKLQKYKVDRLQKVAFCLVSGGKISSIYFDLSFGMN